MMRRVIDGKIYDTETAALLHCWDNGNNDRFHFRTKALYRTPKDRYFLVHEGGAMTDMAKQVDSNNVSGSEAMEVLDRAEAIRFLEMHDGSEVLIKEFSDAVEEG